MKALKDAGVYDLIPNETNLKWEMSNIGTAAQLDQRIGQLRRISRNVRDDSYTPVEYYGATVPRYLANEIENTKKVVNAARRRALLSAYPSWNEIGQKQRSVIEASGNLGELRGVYRSGDDLDELISMHYHETDASYMTQYIDEWHKYCIVREKEEQVVDDIYYIVENMPGKLREILDRGDFQAQIEYIYQDSADFLDVGKRHENIVNYWHDVRAGLK